jgi:hypothetical protein
MAFVINNPAQSGIRTVCFIPYFEDRRKLLSGFPVESGFLTVLVMKNWQVIGPVEFTWSDYTAASY